MGLDAVCCERIRLQALRKEPMSIPASRRMRDRDLPTSLPGGSSRQDRARYAAAAAFQCQRSRQGIALFLARMTFWRGTRRSVESTQISVNAKQRARRPRGLSKQPPSRAFYENFLWV